MDDHSPTERSQHTFDKRASLDEAPILGQEPGPVIGAALEPWPGISVVVPSYNQAEYLSACLESVISQGYPNLQLVVMDGGSTDASVSIIESFHDSIDYWQSSPDEGQAAAINAGMKHANGEIVCWLNSDDLFSEDALWHVAKAYITYPGFGIYIGNGFRLNDATGARTPFAVHGLGFNRRALVEGVDYVQQPSAFFLRRAWNEVGGLDPTLQFGLDWDVIIRIAQTYPVVLINEFLSLSREYQTTKTAAGGLKRCVELCEIGRRHTGQPVTVGAFLYLLDALRKDPVSERSAKVQKHFALLQQHVHAELASVAGDASGFPCSMEDGDVGYLPFPRPLLAPCRKQDQAGLPRITVVVASCGEAELFAQTVDSVKTQAYPDVELLVMDKGSGGGSLDGNQSVERTLKQQEFGFDEGPAHLINAGFARARGEVLVWLTAGDILADGALDKVGRTFRDHLDIDAVLGNVLYFDADRRRPAAQGELKTNWHYGRPPDPAQIARFWTNSSMLPQPPLFFRRALLDPLRGLDESYQCAYDLEFMLRLQDVASLTKLESTLLLRRVPSSPRDAQSRRPAELFRLARPFWPTAPARFADISASYLADLVARRAREPHTSLSRRLTRRALRPLLPLALRLPGINPERLYL